MSRTLLSCFRFVTLGVAVLVVLSAVGCTSNSVPTPTTPTSTSTPTLTPTQTQTSVPPSSTPTPTPTSTPTSYTVNIASQAPIGNYLVDGRGITLYYTVSDRPNYSNLPDETLTAWPAFYVSNIIVPATLNAADFGTYTRDNGVKQTTYKGYPLYYFFQDKVSGDTLGNKLGGVWFVINPDQFPP